MTPDNISLVPGLRHLTAEPGRQRVAWHCADDVAVSVN